MNGTAIDGTKPLEGGSTPHLAWRGRRAVVGVRHLADDAFRGRRSRRSRITYSRPIRKHQRHVREQRPVQRHVQTAPVGPRAPAIPPARATTPLTPIPVRRGQRTHVRCSGPTAVIGGRTFTATATGFGTCTSIAFQWGDEPSTRMPAVLGWAEALITVPEDGERR